MIPAHAFRDEAGAVQVIPQAAELLVDGDAGHATGTGVFGQGRERVLEGAARSRRQVDSKGENRIRTHDKNDVEGKEVMDTAVPVAARGP